MERIEESRLAIRNSIDRLTRIQRTSPGAYQVLLPRIRQLVRTQRSLEAEALHVRRADNLGVGFVVPLIWAGAVTLSGFFGWRVSKQLTEVTDYDKRLEKFIEAKDQGLSDDEALRIIGQSRGLSLATAIVIGSVALAAIFLFRK